MLCPTRTGFSILLMNLMNSVSPSVIFTVSTGFPSKHSTPFKTVSFVTSDAPYDICCVGVTYFKRVGGGRNPAVWPEMSMKNRRLKMPLLFIV